MSRIDNRKLIKEKILQDMIDEENLILERARYLGKLPPDIAINKIFSQNIFLVFLAAFTRIPLFICGKPGSSKTLAVNILLHTFKGQAIHEGKIRCLNGFPSIIKIGYQGTAQSTTTEIENIFKAAYEKIKINFVPLIIFDEMGLAELSPHKPLKILHEYLEKGKYGHVIKKGDLFEYIV